MRTQIERNVVDFFSITNFIQRHSIENNRMGRKINHHRF